MFITVRFGGEPYLICIFFNASVKHRLSVLFWKQWPIKCSLIEWRMNIVSLADGEESLFNPNCRTHILLDDIRRRCNCTKDGKYEISRRTFPITISVAYLTWTQYLLFIATVDLSDESGNLKYLLNHPLSYATELLKTRESFVLIRVESKFIQSNRIVMPSSWLLLRGKFVRFWTLTCIHARKNSYKFTNSSWHGQVGLCMCDCPNDNWRTYWQTVWEKKT